jgi:uncharacterized protein YecT (DUF1311 family)
MIKTLFIVLSLSILGSAAHAQTQVEINKEATENFRKTDKELNTVYQNILTKNAKDPVFTHNLKQAQLLWIKFRDAQVKAKFPDRPGQVMGSIYPTCIIEYKQELTESRIKELRQWLEGTEEGDLCNGTVPFRR